MAASVSFGSPPRQATHFPAARLIISACPSCQQFHQFRQILHDGKVDVELSKIERFKFYDAAGSPEVCLTIATGEQRIYANLLLTIGVVKPTS